MEVNLRSKEMNKTGPLHLAVIAVTLTIAPPIIRTCFSEQEGGGAFDPPPQPRTVEKARPAAPALKVTSIGSPTAARKKEARKINDLKVFNNRLYIGHGCAVANTGPTDVLCFDFAQRQYTNEFTVDDEAIYSYLVMDDRLMIPGVDSTENWKFGNIYVLNETGWVKHRTLPNAVHVNCIASFNKRWFASTGTVTIYGRNQKVSFGSILGSDNEGKNWSLAYATSWDESSVFRVDRLITYRNKLYAFIYALCDVKNEEIPDEYRNSSDQGEGGTHMFYVPDILGTQDAVAYDGKRWQNVDLIPKARVCRVIPCVFKDKLVMSVIAGEYVDYLGGLSKKPKPLLYVFDGQHSEELSMQCDAISDIVEKEDRLLLLIKRENVFVIAETADLKKWRYYALPESVAGPRSIEYHKERFYIGTEDGTIYESSGTGRQDRDAK